jgi:hypothetical protein
MRWRSIRRWAAVALLSGFPVCTTAQTREEAPCTKPGAPPQLPKATFTNTDAIRFNLRLGEHNQLVRDYGRCLDRRSQTALAPPADVAATGNLAAGFYPISPCRKPSADFGRRPDKRDARAVAAHNGKVMAHNRDMESFNLCLEDYVAKARRDVQELRAAVAAANAN